MSRRSFAAPCVRMAVSAVAVVLCAAPVWGEQAPQYGPEVQKRLDALRAKGEPVTLADLTPEPIPPEENAATVYRQAFEAYVEPNEKVEEVESKDFEDWSPDELAEVRAWVEENQRAIALAKRAAAVEKCQFVGKYTGYEQQLPHLHGMRKLALLLLNSVILHLEDGLPKTALEECWVQLRMAQHLGRGNRLPEYRVQAVIVAWAHASLQAVLACPEVGGLDLKRVAESVRQLLERERLAGVLQCERVVWLDALNRPQDWEDMQPQVAQAVKSDDTLRTWLDTEKLALLEGFSKLISLAQKPWYHTAAERQNLDVWISKGLPFRKLPLTGLLMPGESKALEARAFRETILWQMVLGTELELHRRNARSYPDALDGLGLEYLDEVPVDPFSGNPFGYQKEGEGYFLYSVGENGVDDRGERGWRRHRGGVNPETGEWEEGRVEDLDDVSWAINFPRELEVSEVVE